MWKDIPKDTDILVTHGPPYGILDLNMYKEHTGCPHLLKKVMEVRPQLHVFGHIHEGYGIHLEEDTIFHNASSVNVAYKFVNKTKVFDISPKTRNS